MNRLRWNGTRFVPVSKTIAFVTFSNGRYIGLEKKLQKSIETHCPEANVFVFHEFSEIGSPTHSQNPYAFKVYAIQHVRSLGYDVIFWCDSVIRMVRPITSLISKVREQGVYLQADGHKVGTWANDRALEYFGVSRDDAMNLSAIYACILAFDFAHPKTQEFFAKWKRACDDGIFRGSWKNTNHSESTDDRCEGHRHDQTCAELIAHTTGIRLNPRMLSHDVTDPNRYFTSWDKP